MEKDIKLKLKLIDDEIEAALGAISELEEKLDNIEADDEGNIPKDECKFLKQKFTSFNESFSELTNLLSELGIINEEDK